MSRTKLKTKRLADFPKPYRDTLAYWSAFRNLGFDAAEIFFGFGEVSGTPDVLHLQLQTQGKTFTTMCAVLPGVPRAKVLKTWQQLSNIVQTSQLEERERCYREHPIGGSPEHFMLFATKIREKGILVPSMLEFEGGAAKA